MHWTGVWFVALVTLVCFLPALGNGFVAWDDDTNFLDNPSYRGLGPAQLAWMLTNLHAHYMPLTWLTLGFDYVLWGMNPAGYHLTSVLLHATNAALFVLIARRLLGAALPAAPVPLLRRGSLLTALLFAVHPLRVESVVWATGGGAYVWGRTALRARRRPAIVLDLAAGALPIVLAALTLGQVQVWRDSETLWGHALAVGPSATAHAKLGVVRDEQGRTEEAIAHYRAALALHPDMPDAYNDWGIALAGQGRWDEAVEPFRQALALRPGSVEAHLNLAAALERLGRFSEAAEHAREAQRLQTKGR